MSDQRQNIAEWFHTIQVICFEITEGYNALLDLYDKKALEDANFRLITTRTFGSFITIRLTGLLDEINLSNWIGPDDSLNELVRDFKFVVKPLRKELSQWRDLYNYRNHVLAHNFRKEVAIDGVRKHISVLHKIEEYDAPKTLDEIHFICECVAKIDFIRKDFMKVGKIPELAIVEPDFISEPRISETNREEKMNSVFQLVKNAIDLVNERRKRANP